jgi:hypothetical protein
MSDLEQLLRASVVILRQGKRIAELEHESALLRAQLRLMHLKLERRFESTTGMPAFLRPQAE